MIIPKRHRIYRTLTIRSVKVYLQLENNLVKHENNNEDHNQKNKNEEFGLILLQKLKDCQSQNLAFFNCFNHNQFMNYNFPLTYGNLISNVHNHWNINDNINNFMKGDNVNYFSFLNKIYSSTSGN